MSLTKWTPTTNLAKLRRFGKLGEELSECGAVASRCIIQGIDEIDPGSGKTNHQRLIEEMADVIAQINCTVDMLNIDPRVIAARVDKKEAQMREWESMFQSEEDSDKPVFVVDHIGSSFGEGPENSTVIVGYSLRHDSLSRGAKLFERPSAHGETK